MSGFDVTVIVLAVLAEPLILLEMLAGVVKLGLLTAHLHKPRQAADLRAVSGGSRARPVSRPVSVCKSCQVTDLAGKRREDVPKPLPPEPLAVRLRRGGWRRSLQRVAAGYTSAAI